VRFGLFSLYYAPTAPARFVHGIDLNTRRIAMARRAAARLSIANVAFEQGDARTFKATARSRPPTCSTSCTIAPDTVRRCCGASTPASPRRRARRQRRRHAPAPQRWFT